MALAVAASEKSLQLAKAILPWVKIRKPMPWDAASCTVSISPLRTLDAELAPRLDENLGAVGSFFQAGLNQLFG